MSGDELLNVHQVAKILGMSTRWVYDETDRSESTGGREGLRGVRFGRRRRWQRSDVDAYIEKHSPPRPDLTSVQET